MEERVGEIDDIDEEEGEEDGEEGCPISSSQAPKSISKTRRERSATAV